MGSKAWILVMFTMLACTLPVHALIISARRLRPDADSIARDSNKGRIKRPGLRDVRPMMRRLFRRRR
jgi:hypothetical protein